MSESILGFRSVNEPTGQPPAVVTCRGLVREFGDGDQKRRVVDNVDLDVRAGELTLLTGPSGCGKTTLVSLIAGLLSPTKGSIKVFGQELSGITPSGLSRFRLHEVGFIFQQFNLLPTLTAAENAGLPLCIQGHSRTAAAAKGKRWLAELGLGQHSEKYPRELSGGQQQRVAIARALVHEPHLVICDEPTSALDASTGRLVMDMLKSASVRPGRAVLVVTHDNRVYEFADRIIEMEDGRVTNSNAASSIRLGAGYAAEVSLPTEINMSY